MAKEYFPLLAFLLYASASSTGGVLKGSSTYTNCSSNDGKSLYHFTTKYLSGQSVSLNEYRGNVTLLLNVATFCGYTVQYLYLNALMKKFSTPGKHRCGFSVLAFPCNQFHYQEPGANAREIWNGLKYVRPGFGFVPYFPLFHKIQVNGDKEDVIYTFLKSRCPLPGGVISQAPSSISWSPVKSTDISWNFEKFLVDHNGLPVKRYLPSTKPFELIDDITTLIEKC